jgi:hypothetical protein
LITEEPTHAESDDHPVTADGQPGYVTPVAAVIACGRMLTLRAWSRGSAARRVDHQVVVREHGLAHREVQAREEEVFE